MKLRPHQQRFIEQNPDKALLVWEMRTGKSLPAKLWSEHESRNKNSLIICMKSNKKTWVELCPHATVLSKEEFKKYGFKNPSSVVVDEAHFFASPLFITKKRSQLSEALYKLVRENPELPVLLLTATPLTNDPASLHTLLTYIGKYIDWKKYRNVFYSLEKRPYLPYPAWMPKKNWRKEANKILEKYADIVSLKDCVNELPAVIEEIIHIKSTPKKYKIDEEYHWTKDHLHEQTFKIDTLKELANGHRKIILVCYYTEQIDDLKDKLKELKPVYVLDGRTKDQEQIISDAQNDSDCFFIVQSKIGMGWDGYMFDAMVFVSMAHRVIDHTQMKGRLTSVDYPKPNIFYYINAGKWDDRIYESVSNGEDFNIHNYATRVTTKK